MNTRLFFCCLLLISLPAAASIKDTLSLRINGADKGSITLKYNNTLIKDPENAKLTVDSTAWVLKVTSKITAHVTISNDEGDKTITLQAGQVYTILNNKLADSNFVITPTITITIKDAAGNLLKAYSAISYSVKGNAGSVDNPTQPGSGSGQDGRQPPSSSAEYLPGSAILDALALARTTTNNPVKMAILAYYTGLQNPRPTQLDSAYKTNKYLDSLTTNIVKAGSAVGASNGLSAAFNAIGGLDVTNIADGLARFLVKRTRQELSTAFFQKFRKAVNDTKDLVTLFPKTVVLLNAIDDEIYEYERYLENLKAAFKEDIADIYTHLDGIIANHPEFFKANYQLEAALRTGTYIARELKNQAHPGDILAGYPLETLPEAVGDNYKGIVQTMQLVSISLRDTTTSVKGNYWVAIPQIRELVNNRTALKYFLGLVYQQAVMKYDSVKFDKTTLAALLNSVAGTYDTNYEIYDKYKRYILGLGDKVTAINKMIVDYDVPATDSAALEKYARYFKASVDMLKYCSEIRKLPGIKTKGEAVNFDKYFEITYATTDVVTAINRRDYASAINNTVHVYRLATTPPDSTQSRYKSDMTRIAKYGTFMAGVAAAKNSEEVATAIEKAALPAGSSRIKRESPFNVSLNAYTGLFAGHEFISGVNDNKWFNTYGVTAPIGVSISRGHSIFFLGTGESGWKEGKKGWSTSLFLSLVDVGAVAAFRFQDDKTAEVPSIQLKNLFAPGAYLSLGIPKSPLSINLGVQQGANLRKIYDAGGTLANDYGDKSYWRLSAGVCVDIPLLNIYTKQK